ncbi:DUF6289 family protein [Nonomuraea sp. NPDC052129]|uniref:DUF6289 family protein n=1 Tax=Nonomuraea sp. NPDC052129 TaxID=3154651 RepID=UPI003422D059
MIRRALVAAALATTALVALPAGPAQASACPVNYLCITTYYSDAAHTTEIGLREELCDGTLYVWGVRSNYSDYYRGPC